jgi:hypothetical protein
MEEIKSRIYISWKSISWIVIVIVSMTIGCVNETEYPTPVDYLIIDTLSTSGSFQTVINRTVYASLFGSYLTDLKLDLNNDGTDDIQFSCSVYHHTVYDEWSASVSTLNENVAMDIQPLTVSYARYFNKYFNSSTNDSIKIDYYENYYASRQYPSNVTIVTKTEEYPAIHSAGDTLNANCTWKSGGYMLKWDDHSIREAHYNIVSGTWRSVYKKYIGIRFSEKSEYVYGWIELSVEGYNITMHRYSIHLNHPAISY